MNVQSAALAPSKPSHPAQATRTRRPHLLIASGLLVLFLLLIGSLVAAFSLGNHTGGQPSASSTTPIATPVSTPTATQPTTTCTVNDSADILNQSQICSTGNSPLSYSLVVNTSNNGGSFDSSQTPPARTIVVNIIANPSHHGHNQAQVMISGGSGVPLTSDQYHSAQEAFNRVAHSGDYTSATLAAIQSLQASGA